MTRDINYHSSRRDYSQIYRRVSIKRKTQASGLFDSSWLDITEDVKKFGTVRLSADLERVNKFTISNLKMILANDEGKYSPETRINSLWYSYGSQQRSLVQIEAGFIEQTTTGGLVTSREVPGNDASWDESFWDEPLWDGLTNVVFKGIISGDILESDKNEVALNIRPLTQLFKDYPASLLDAYDTSMTAQKFMEMVRDHTDSTGNYIFRPFFDDTTSTWNIDATTRIYTNLNTSSAQDVIDASVWDVMQKLAEVENYAVFVTRDGQFNFKDKAGDSSIKFEFFGNGGNDNTYGQTLKRVVSYGQRVNSYYSRVQVKYNEADTSTSYTVKESPFEVNSFNTPWNFGHRTYSFENIWMSATSAEAVADALFSQLSNIKNEVEFTSSFVPHLDIFDHVNLTYNTNTPADPNSLWDQNNWGPDADELIWDDDDGAGIDINSKEFKLLSIDINFDSLECKFKAREA